MRENKPLRVAQLGVTHEHAAGKMRSLRLRPDLFQILGVVDDRQSTPSPFYINWPKDGSVYDGIPRLSEQQLLDLPDLDAVFVEVTNLDLVPAARRCLDRNLPLHLDKPGGLDLPDFASLRLEYEKRRLPLQMGYMFRGNPAMQWSLAAARRGWLGDIFEIQAGMSHDYGDASYQAYLGAFPGGILFNLGCHFIDFLVALLGAPVRSTPFLKTAPGDPDGIANNCVAVLEYPRATATLRACSREVAGLDSRRLKICGTKGTIELCPLERFDGQPLQLHLTLKEGNEERAAGSHTLDFGPVRDRYEDLLESFANALLRQKQRQPAAPADEYLLTAPHDILVQKVLLQSTTPPPPPASHSSHSSHWARPSPAPTELKT